MTAKPSKSAHPAAARANLLKRDTSLVKDLQRPMLGLLGFVVLIVLWHLVSSASLFGSQVPSPVRVLQALLKLLGSANGWASIYASTYRVVSGVAIGLIIATPLGFALGWYAGFRFAVEPMINFFRAIPPIALIPLVIIYLGIGEAARISVIVYSSFFVCVVIIYEGIRAIDPLFIRAARVLGASSLEIFVKVILPLSVPHLLTAVRVAIGTAWMTLVAAELIAAEQGVGAIISEASNYFDIPTVYAGIVIIGVIALTMDRLLKAFTKQLVAWQEAIV
jgi:NitT/TauT family transport system permease protein